MFIKKAQLKVCHGSQWEFFIKKNTLSEELTSGLKSWLPKYLAPQKSWKTKIRQTGQNNSDVDET